MTVTLLSYGSQVPGDGTWRSLPGSEFRDLWKLVKLLCTGTFPLSGKVKLLIIYQLWSRMKAHLSSLIWFGLFFFLILNICTMLYSYKGIVRRLAFCHYCFVCACNHSSESWLKSSLVQSGKPVFAASDTSTGQWNHKPIIWDKDFKNIVSLPFRYFSSKWSH